tara:strand:+ start:146 stop:388 length:243 start_codon:yes stop_codon:yes gene_type:complete
MNNLLILEKIIFNMEFNKIKLIAEELNNLACKECTKGWLNKQDGLSNPLEDIKQCAKEGLITPKLYERLFKEIQELNKGS